MPGCLSGFNRKQFHESGLLSDLASLSLHCYCFRAFELDQDVGLVFIKFNPTGMPSCLLGFNRNPSHQLGLLSDLASVSLQQSHWSQCLLNKTNVITVAVQLNKYNYKFRQACLSQSNQNNYKFWDGNMLSYTNANAIPVLVGSPKQTLQCKFCKGAWMTTLQCHHLNFSTCQNLHFKASSVRRYL